jgi:hypothetical protein
MSKRSRKSSLPLNVNNNGDDNDNKMTINDKINRMSIQELDDFYNFVDADYSGDQNDETAHMLWRGDIVKPKNNQESEMTPMYCFKGHYISSQRISLVLSGLDIKYKHHIETKCGNNMCIRPSHLECKKTH